MYIYTFKAPSSTDIHIARALKNCYPHAHPKAKSPTLSSLYGYALLSYLVHTHYGETENKALLFSDAGKPYFPDSEVFFSLSHSESQIFCALASFPVACDVQTHRKVSEKTMQRVLAKQEQADDFFVSWCLKECYVKLTDDLKAPFSKLNFHITGNTAQYENFFGVLYRELPHITFALLAKQKFDAPKLNVVDEKTFFSYLLQKCT